MHNNEPSKDVKKVQMEKLLEDMREGMSKMSKKHDEAFTSEEKGETLRRLKMMEQNYNKMWKKYEMFFHQGNNNGHEEKNNNKNNNGNLFKEYHGLAYDVDDPEIRKEIGKSLSYDSGYQGYTEKETQELRKLLELTD